MPTIFRRVPAKQSPFSVTAEDMAAAVQEVRDAEARFNQAADPGLVDAAGLELTAAEIKLGYLVRMSKAQQGLV